MGSFSTNEFKSGLKIILENDPYSIVENEMVTTVADFDPKIRQHLSWMEYGRGIFNLIGVGAPVQLLGNGDDGFRTTRARRKIPEIEDDLMFVVSSDIAVSLIVDTSTTVLLP